MHLFFRKAGLKIFSYLALNFILFFQSMTDILQFVGGLAEFAGPILIMVGVNAGPAIGALIGTLAGAISVIVGQGLQELARTEPPIINIPTEPPLVTTTTTQQAVVNPNQVISAFSNCFKTIYFSLFSYLL